MRPSCTTSTARRAKGTAASAGTSPRRAARATPGSTSSTRRRRRTASGDDTSTRHNSFEIRANASQRLPANLRARANVDYFSNIATQQTYYNNLYDASRRQRVYGGNVAGTWGANSLSATYNVSELFYGTTDSTVYGSKPRPSRSTARPARWPASPVYLSMSSDYYSIARISKSGTTEIDNSLTRVDVSPSFRLPLTKWPFLTLNSSIAFRNTWYPRASTRGGRRSRSHCSGATSTCAPSSSGPSSPASGTRPATATPRSSSTSSSPPSACSASPTSTRTDQIVKLDSYDYTLGGTTRFTYGLTNRFLAKVREAGGRSTSREFLNIAVSQTYYTDEEASLYDSAYASSTYGGVPQSKFSPVLLVVRGGPKPQISGTLRIEFTHVNDEIATMSAAGTVASHGVQVTGALSQRRLSVATGGLPT